MKENTTPSNHTVNRVLIIDRHPLIRCGVRHILETSGDFDVISDTSSSVEGIECAVREEPDIIILDLDLDLSGLDTIKALRKEHVNAHIVVLTNSELRHDIFTLVDEGVDGYLLKDTEPTVLLQQMQRIAKGQRVLNEKVERIVNERQEDEPIYSLTHRELSVLALVAQGFSNRKIADELYISEETVKVHIRNLLHKLNIHSRLTAAIIYLEYFGKK